MVHVLGLAIYMIPLPDDLRITRIGRCRIYTPLGYETTPLGKEALSQTISWELKTVAVLSVSEYQKNF